MKAHPTAAHHPYFDATVPLAFAHRGGAKLRPENTLTAFRHALALGCRYLETDLRMTRDGVLVTHHDPTVQRTTNGYGRVAELTIHELKQLDAGYRFQDARGDYPFRGRGITIPTLREVVEVLPEARINVELKPNDPRIVDTLWSLMEQHSAHDRFLVAAARTPLVARFRTRSEGRVPTSAGKLEVAGFLYCAWKGRSPRRVPFEALQVPIRHGPLPVVTRRLIDLAHQCDLQVHVWTVDDPTVMADLLELGVDGIMSDRPDELMRTLNPRATSEPVWGSERPSTSAEK